MRFAGIVLLLCSVTVFAQISPGDLSRYHAKLEGLNNCTLCHDLGEAVSDAKCLTCHAAIHELRKANSGYHASAEVRAKSCAKCHGEHYGREYELIYWKDGAEKFDHAPTGYPLVGAHAKQTCRACHTAVFHSEAATEMDSTTNAARSYLGLSSACVTCHADEHGEQLTDDCGSCHNLEKWTPAPLFAHERAKYPLTGKHADVGCAKCHKSEHFAEAITNRIQDPLHPAERTRYQGLDYKSCESCHNDTHKGKFGDNCAGCHTTESFAVARMAADFDHNKTGYPLVGKHVGVECAKCHASGKMTEPVKHATCKDCHRDEHRGQFAARADGGACEACHDVSGFVPARYGVAEHALSKYPLAGGHLATPCIACHAETLTDARGSYAKFAFGDPNCRTCHKDAHRGQLDKFMQTQSCDYCHTVENWRNVTFNHDSTEFPLIGKHTKTECMKCHVREHAGTEMEALRMSPLARDCELCHADPHRGQFVLDPTADVKSNCKRCHDAGGWTTLLFDHTRDARWALEGAHRNVACHLCHKTEQDSDGAYAVYRPLSSACRDCHSDATPSKP